MNRIEQLEQFLREDPGDPFNSYALALEYLKTDARRAFGLFDHLISSRPDYLPTYYPFAHLLIEMQQADRAEAVFQAGIAQARMAGDNKTLRELSAAYNDWMFDRS